MEDHAAFGSASAFRAPVAAALLALGAAGLALVSCAPLGTGGSSGAGAPVVAATGDARQPRSVGGADCDRTSGYDVLIVGAGLAGLAAARELTHLGRSVLLLEATDRVGGRGFVGEVRAGKAGERRVPIDYGGAWIHGVATNPLTHLVDAMGFERSRSELDVPFYVDGRRASAEEHELFNEAYEAYEQALVRGARQVLHEQAVAELVCEQGERVATGDLEAEELCARLDRELAGGAAATRLCERARQVERGRLAAEPFCGAAAAALRQTSDVAADYLPRAARFADVLALLVATAGPMETAAELEASSAVDAAGFEAGEDDLVDRGMGAFVREYGARLPVCLRSPVTRIEYGDRGVTVAAGGREYEGAYALVTVSVGVLRAGKIRFEPPLPGWKREAIDGLRMGHMQKVILPFERDVFDGEAANSWVLHEGELDPAERRLAAAGGLADEERRVMAFVIKPLGAAIAIGFYGGEWARLLESRCAGLEHGSGPRSPSGCDEAAIGGAVRALEAMYGAKEVRGALLADQIHVTRWSLEPYTLGAYSVPAPGRWDQRQVLARPVAAGEEAPPRLFFAGEACSRTIFNGSFPGAFETGLQAARDIHVELLAGGEDLALESAEGSPAH